MDDIALRSENLKNLVLALPYLESNGSKVGLVIISANPVCDNQEHPSIIFLKSLNIVSKEANNFKYLESYVSGGKKYFATGNAWTWITCNNLHTIWMSKLCEKIKITFFKACIETVLLYGYEKWMVSKQLQKWLNWTYTRCLMRVKNNEWTQHCTLDQIYDKLTMISDDAKARKTRFPAHYFKVKDEVNHDLIFYNLLHRQRGRKPLAYPEIHVRDTNLPSYELKTVMEDRDYY